MSTVHRPFPVIGHLLRTGLWETVKASANKTPSHPSRARHARDKYGWWPPLGWVGLISRSHAKKYLRTGHFSNAFCRIIVILCFGGNSDAGRPSAFHDIRLTSGESITPFLNGWPVTSRRNRSPIERTRPKNPILEQAVPYLRAPRRDAASNPRASGLEGRAAPGEAEKINKAAPPGATKTPYASLCGMAAQKRWMTKNSWHHHQNKGVYSTKVGYTISDSGLGGGADRFPARDLAICPRLFLSPVSQTSPSL